MFHNWCWDLTQIYRKQPYWYIKNRNAVPMSSAPPNPRISPNSKGLTVSSMSFSQGATGVLSTTKSKSSKDRLLSANNNITKILQKLSGLSCSPSLVIPVIQDIPLLTIALHILYTIRLIQTACYIPCTKTCLVS